MSQSPPPDNRLLALRSAAQEASDFALGDDQVRRFMALRDAGTTDGEIAAEMGLDAEIVTELGRAGEAQGGGGPTPPGGGAGVPPPGAGGGGGGPAPRGGSCRCPRRGSGARACRTFAAAAWRCRWRC